VEFVQKLLQNVGNVPGVSVLLFGPKDEREFGSLDATELRGDLGEA